MSTVSTILMTLFLVINQSFFMGFFFMIASYFAPGSYDRKGAARYVSDRLKRLGIPVLFYIVVVSPLLSYRLSLHYGSRASLGRYLELYVKDRRGLGVAQMWFVETLLIFSLLYVFWRFLTRSSTTASSSENKAPGNLAIAGFALVLGVLTFAVRIRLPVGWELELLSLQFPHFVQYIAFFVVGVVAYRRNWFAGLSDSQGKVWRWIILLMILVFFVLFVAGGALEGNLDPFMGGLHWQSFAYAVWEQLMGMAMVVTLLVWFRTRSNRQGPLVRRLSATAYAAYVVHAPVIVLMALGLRRIELDLALKWVLAAPVAVSLSFVVGHAVKSLPLARDIL